MFRLFYVTLLLLFVFNLIHAQSDVEKRIQTQCILAEDGDIIEIPAGNFSISGTLSLDEKKNITLRGAGQDKTILSFKGQKQGAEGLKVTNCTNIVLENFTMEDAKGDIIKTQNVSGIIFRDITARWTGKPDESNGSYAL
ncbi:MAG: hypothetical protein ACKOCO_04085, partial [Bacteroidota bacterium]